MVPSDVDLGPAMRKLTELQRKFVIAMFETGISKVGVLAGIAGYAGDEGALRSQGHTLSRNPRVLDAIQEEGKNRLKSFGIIATNKLVEIAVNDERKDQLKAIEMILNRSGLHAVAETRSFNVNANIGGDGGQMGRLKAACEKLGLNVKDVLTKANMVVDAEFTEITEIKTIEDDTQPVEEIEW